MDQMNSVCTVYHEVCTIGLELNEECHKKLYCRCSGNRCDVKMDAYRWHKAC